MIFSVYKNLPTKIDPIEDDDYKVIIHSVKRICMPRIKNRTVANCEKRFYNFSFKNRYKQLLFRFDYIAT